MILIVSDGKLKGIPGVLAMSIFTIKPEHAKEHPFYRKMISDNRFKETFYLGTRTGRYSYVSITDIKLVATSLIFEKASISLSKEEMTSIDVRLADCVNNSVVLACQVCDRNCGSCQLLKAVNSISHYNN